MDPWAIIAIIAVVVAVIGFLVGGKGRVVGGIAVVAFIFFFIMSTFVVIQTRHVGVEVSFGKPGTTYTNGFHWKNPFANVHKYDGTLQTEKYDSGKAKDQGDPFLVHLGNGSTATLDVTYQWKLSDNVDSIYKNYPSADTKDLNDKIVYRQVQQSLNDAYAAFDPTAGLRAQSQALIDQSNGKTPTPPDTSITGSQTYQLYAKQAETQLVGVLTPQGVQFVALTIGNITYDTNTQNRLNELNNAIVQTQIAIQQEATALATATANKNIAQDPPSLQQNIQTCIDATAKNPSAFPVGWNCFTGSGVGVVTSGK